MTRIKRSAVALTCCLISWLPLQTAQAQISQVPLFLGGAVEPNIMFTLDDSGSMHWEMMPSSLIWSYFVFPRADDVYGDSDYTNYVVSFNTTNNIYGIWVRSSDVNTIYYNPEMTYAPWIGTDDTTMGNVATDCAPHNPYTPDIDGDGNQNEASDCRDLTQNNTQSAHWEYYDGTLANFPSGASSPGWASQTFWPATYFVLDNGGDPDIAGDFTQVEIRSGFTYTGSAARTDCTSAPTCTYAEEIQNFANWYTYYRSRILLARAGVGHAFARQGGGIRVGFSAINQGSKTVDGVSSPGALINGVRKFTGTDRAAFFSSLYGHDIPTSSTPLRRALDDVGQYYQRSDNKGPWGNTPGTDNSTAHLSCRQSYNILMTDGYWNSTAAPTAGTDDADDVDGPAITGPEGQNYQYEPENPYQDGFSDTLADVAMYYWNRDLRPNLENKIPTNVADEAFWQHLVNFTVGLGVTGTLDPNTDLPALTAGTESWPQASDGADAENIDDLWHAAINSRGEFHSASSPDRFATALAGSLNQIAGRTGSSASIATNSTRLNNDTFVYQARFDSADWSGELLAFLVDQTTGELIDADTATTERDPTWEGATELAGRTAASRKIFAHEAADTDADGFPGVEFTWSSLPATHKAMLNVGPSGVDALGEDRLDYLRGVQTLELKNTGGVFRNRVSILGDIVNSDPWFVGTEDIGYNKLSGTEGTSYVTYRASDAYKNRPGVVYVGAADGMLHAFHASTGAELFAYMPESLFADLWRLTDPAYSHRYYVDGAPQGKDAYINVWKTVLVTTLGAGGKGLFALDVTDPANFDKTDVMWEFTEDEDRDGDLDGDLGYTIGQASVARMPNGDWVAIFGNGYGSTNHSAVLYIVDIEDGSIIKKIDTGAGDGATPNGLSTPVAVDTNNDRIVDRIYAGDLLGNMWAFDVSHDSDTGFWDVDYKSGSDPVPLFAAAFPNPDGNVQQITSKPQAGKHPKGGVLVYFGTGKYFEVGDGSVTDKNTFYGIWDDFTADDAGTVGRNSLLQQEITHESLTVISVDGDGNDVASEKISDADGNMTDNPFDWDVRASTENAVDWETHEGWYIDLKSPVLGWESERVVSSPLLLEGRVVFSTMIPSADACDYGGTGWLMELSSLDGARLPVTPFDLNGDGAFDSQDYVTIKVDGVDANGDPIKTEVQVPASGKKSKVGIIKTPAVVKTDTREFKFASGSTGEIERTLESRSFRTGRQSWRQLQ